MKAQYYIFTIDEQIAKVDNVVDAQKRDEIIVHHKETYPNVPIYWIKVNEG